MSAKVDATYKEQLISTVQEVFPKYIQKKLLSDLEKKHIVKLSKNKPAAKVALDLTEIAEDDQLIRGILSGDVVARFIERYEFLKSYKFAAIFNASNSNEAVFKELEISGEVLNFQSEQFSNDNIFDDIHNKVVKPTMFAIGSMVIMKFNRLLTGHVPGSGIKKEIKYPILGVYFKHLGTLEIRFDRVKTYLQEDEFFYHKQIELVAEWFKDKGFEVESINLPPVIEYIKSQEQDEVNVHAQAMSLKSGGKATLEIGENENYILPLLGELKELMKANEGLFQKSPEIQKLLDMFIFETETNADLPWISLQWKGKDKSKGTIVKFKHNYMNQGYTFLQYYGLQTDMEKMDNVTEYIIGNKDALDRSEAVRQSEAGEIAEVS